MEQNSTMHTAMSQPDFAAFAAEVFKRKPQRQALPEAVLHGITRLGRLVQMLRTKHPWSLEALAARTGLSWLWLALLEQGMLLPEELTSDAIHTLGQVFPVQAGVVPPEVAFRALVEDMLPSTHIEETALGHSSQSTVVPPTQKPASSVMPTRWPSSDAGNFTFYNPDIIAIRDYITRKPAWSPEKVRRYLKLLKRHELQLRPVAGTHSPSTRLSGPTEWELLKQELAKPSRIRYAAIPKTGVTGWVIAHASLDTSVALHLVSANGTADWIECGAVSLQRTPHGPEVVIDNAQLSAHMEHSSITSGVFVVTPTDRFQRGQSAVFVIEPRPIDVGAWSAEELAQERYAVEAWHRKAAMKDAFDEFVIFLHLEVFSEVVNAMQSYPQETIEDWGLVRHWDEMIRELDPWQDRLRRFLGTLRS